MGNEYKPKISAFCLTTNSLSNGYPVIESIKSWLPVLDELVIIDGGSTDKTISEIKKIGDKKIKIICDSETIWEDDWIYSRMGKNFNRGLQECTGDIVIKFDIDYILHEDGTLPKYFRGSCYNLANNSSQVAMAVTRLNFVLADRYFVKSERTLGIDRRKLEHCSNVKVVFGMDTERWGFGYDFITPKFEENGIWFGEMIRNSGNQMVPKGGAVYNYDNVFSTIEEVKRKRLKHYLAELRQRDLKYKHARVSSGVHTYEQVKANNEFAWEHYEGMCLANLKKGQYKIAITQHPKVVQDALIRLSHKCQGYDFFGRCEKANYY